MEKLAQLNARDERFTIKFRAWRGLPPESFPYIVFRWWKGQRKQCSVLNKF